MVEDHHYWLTLRHSRKTVCRNPRANKKLIVMMINYHIKLKIFEKSFYFKGRKKEDLVLASMKKH